MKNKVLLTIGAILILIGFVKPDFSALSNILPNNNPALCLDEIKIAAPTDPELKKLAEDVVDCFGGNDKNALRLAYLYRDLARLISFDKNNEVVKTTGEIREANRVSGMLLNMDIKNEYENLANACDAVIVYCVGNKEVFLDEELRENAVKGFEALSWACYKGSK